MIALKSKWRHYNGRVYTVVLIANERTQYPEKYPVTVVYQSESGVIWARPYSEWGTHLPP